MTPRTTPGLDRWMEVYAPALAECAAEGKYGWRPESAPVIAGKMRAAFERGDYNHDGPAIKRACKRLGIKMTRTAIEAFLTTGDAK